MHTNIYGTYDQWKSSNIVLISTSNLSSVQILNKEGPAPPSPRQFTVPSVIMNADWSIIMLNHLIGLVHAEAVRFGWFPRFVVIYCVAYKGPPIGNLVSTLLVTSCTMQWSRPKTEGCNKCATIPECGLHIRPLNIESVQCLLTFLWPNWNCSCWLAMISLIVYKWLGQVSQ